MKVKARTKPWFTALLLVSFVTLVSVGVALAAGNIDPNHRFAWSASAGWINFSPENGGVTVFSDHLEGYAWSENFGWIRLGSYEGGGSHQYGNTSANDYGVNRSSSGKLSGYAWSPSAGWINFDPAGGGVTIDPPSGVFQGYAWGENVGWIKFSGDEYGVVTNFQEHRLYLPAVTKK